MASFGKAFAAARKAGKSEFTWQGKAFHTRLASETPKNAPTPSPAPRGPAASGAPTPTPAPRGASGASRSTAGKVSAKSGASRSTQGKTSPRSGASRSTAGKVQPKRNTMSGGSLFGGLIKWGDQTSKKVQSPYPHNRKR